MQSLCGNDAAGKHKAVGSGWNWCRREGREKRKGTVCDVGCCKGRKTIDEIVRRRENAIEGIKTLTTHVYSLLHPYLPVAHRFFIDVSFDDFLHTGRYVFGQDVNHRMMGKLVMNAVKTFVVGRSRADPVMWSKQLTTNAHCSVVVKGEKRVFGMKKRGEIQGPVAQVMNMDCIESVL